MNKGFVIDKQYDHGIGLLEIDETQKLIKHLECFPQPEQPINAYSFLQYTVDIYENGLIKVHRVRADRLGTKTIPQELLNINITIGEYVDKLTLELVENIYDPYCKKKCLTSYQSFCYCNGSMTSATCLFQRPLFSGWMPNSNGVPFERLFMSTFEQLHTIKKMKEVWIENVFAMGKNDARTHKPKRDVEMMNQKEQEAYHAGYEEC